MKNFFFVKDNILDKKMKVMIKSYEFTGNRKNLADKMDEIISFYAFYFTDDDLEKARI